MPDHGLTWGVLPADTFDRVLVFQPHFDDAAMGAGLLLLAHPGSTVCTVFAGWPDRYPDEVTEWDALGGFQTGDDVVAARRQEELAALEVLGAEHHWLDFPDHQYLEPDERPTADDVAPAIAATVDAVAPTAVVLPMGIANPDHVVVHDAGVQVARAAPRPRVVRLRGRRLQAHPRHAGLAGLEAVPLRPLADADDRARRHRTTLASAPRSSATPRNSSHCAATTRSRHGSTAQWPSSSGMLAPPPPGWERMRDS